MAVVVGGGAGSVMRRSSSVFLSSLPIFLLVSLLLLTFRSVVHLGTLSLTSFLHRDPSVRSLLTRLQSSPPLPSPPPSLPSPFEHHRRYYPSRPPSPPRHRRPHHSHFLRPSSRLHNDDNDVFSDTDIHASLHRRRHRYRPTLLHSSSLNFCFWFPDNDGLLLRVKKVRVPNANPSVVFFFADDDSGEEDQNLSSTFVPRFLEKEGSDLDRSDAVTLVYLACLFSAAHAYAIVGFLFSYSCALGIVYVASTACLLRRRLSAFHIVYHGSKVGIRRLPVLLFLRWSTRDALTQLLCICLFSEFKDQLSLLKLFVKVKLMPFIMTATPPSLQFGDVSTDRFLLFWTILDAVMAIVFAVDYWVAVMERNGGGMSGCKVIKEGFYLLTILITQAIFLKTLEMLICGVLGTRVMTIIGGPVFSMAMQTVIEVYFMVVWLMFYFAARCRAGQMDSRSFGWDELEDSFNGCLR